MLKLITNFQEYYSHSLAHVAIKVFSCSPEIYVDGRRQLEGEIVVAPCGQSTSYLIPE